MEVNFGMEYYLPVGSKSQLYWFPLACKNWSRNISRIKIRNNDLGVPSIGVLMIN